MANVNDFDSTMPKDFWFLSSVVEIKSKRLIDGQK